MSIDTLKSHWKTFFTNPTTRYIFIFTVVLLIFLLNRFASFLIFIEARKGVTLNDPLFHYFPAINCTVPIFIIIYTSLVAAIIGLLPNPRHLMLALQTYILMVFFRFIAMYLLPLEVPNGIIILIDPVVSTLGPSQVLTKDLFFSGHTASLTILFLTARNKYLKYIFFVLTIILATLILLQKAHYTIDVLAAPFFVFAAYSIAKKIDEKIFNVSLKEY